MLNDSLTLLKSTCEIPNVRKPSQMWWWCCCPVISVGGHNWLIIPTESPIRPLKCGGRASVLLTFVGETIWEVLCCCSSGILSLFSLLLLFVSLPVFIKLVKFLLQCCQACIILCSSYHCALQLPGNWVWRRHAKRQRTPPESPSSEHIIDGTHKVYNGHISMNYN